MLWSINCEQWTSLWFTNKIAPAMMSEQLAEGENEVQLASTWGQNELLEALWRCLWDQEARLIWPKGSQGDFTQFRYAVWGPKMRPKVRKLWMREKYSKKDLIFLKKLEFEAKNCSNKETKNESKTTYHAYWFFEGCPYNFWGPGHTEKSARNGVRKEPSLMITS